MGRHLADHRQSSDGARTKQFLKIERASGEEGSHPQTKAVFARPTLRDASAKVREFVRIERDGTA